MKGKRDCEIVQDLLPNYIDRLTNEETNEFIEEHLKECSKCKEIFENMKKDLNVDKTDKNTREVKYIKKYNKKLRILELLVIVLLIIALAFMTNYYLIMKNAYLRAANAMIDMVTEGMYPDTFYATIEEISDPGIYDIREIKVKGLDINDKNHRDRYYFIVSLDCIGDNFKIKWNNTDINFEQLKVGQKVAIYNYGDTLESEPNNLSNVRMIVVLDEAI